RLRRRAGDADDGGIQRDQQLRQRDEAERQPASIGRGRLRRRDRVHAGRTARKVGTAAMSAIATATTTAVIEPTRPGLTVMSKTTPSAMPVRASHEMAAARRAIPPRLTLMPVYAPTAAIRTYDTSPTPAQGAHPGPVAAM